MSLSLRDVVNDVYKPETMSQAVVVTRIKDLACEGDRIADELKRIEQLRLRIAQLKTVLPELLSLLDSLPNEGCNEPSHFGVG